MNYQLIRVLYFEAYSLCYRLQMLRPGCFFESRLCRVLAAAERRLDRRGALLFPVDDGRETLCLPGRVS